MTGASHLSYLYTQRLDMQSLQSTANYECTHCFLLGDCFIVARPFAHARAHLLTHARTNRHTHTQQTPYIKTQMKMYTCMYMYM